MTSPLQIRMMLHYAESNLSYVESPIAVGIALPADVVEQERYQLVQGGLLSRDPERATVFHITEAGRDYVDALLSAPWMAGPSASISPAGTHIHYHFHPHKAHALVAVGESVQITPASQTPPRQQG